MEEMPESPLWWHLLPASAKSDTACVLYIGSVTDGHEMHSTQSYRSYIAYLMDLLAKDDQNGEAEAFKAEIKKTDVKEEKRKKELVSTRRQRAVGCGGAGIPVSFQLG